MNDIHVGAGDREPNEEYVDDTSTIEELLTQAMTQQLVQIVESQRRGKKISYENQHKQALTLQSLAQTTLMLTDSETVFLHGAKFQGVINRAFLEGLLGAKTYDRIITTESTDNEPGIISEEPGTES